MIHISDDKEVVLVEHGEDYFCYIDRKVDYAFTFKKDKIDDIIKFLLEIKGDVK